MKRKLLILFCAALVTSAQAQWSKTMETPTKASYANTFSAVAVTPSGETFVSGSLSKEFVSFGTTELDFTSTGDSFLFKYSATGEPVWANVINGESTQINAITYDNDGNIYVAGTYQGESETVFNGQENTKETATCNSYYDMIFEYTTYLRAGFIAKYSSDGKLLKLETFKSNISDMPDGAYMFLEVNTNFSIQDLQFVNGKLYASVLYAGKTEKDGFSFSAKAFNSGGMAADLYSGCVISLTTALTIDAILADLSPVAEGANALFTVRDSKMYVNADHIYAIFGAMGNQTLSVNSQTDNISIPFNSDDDLYSRAYILADVNINGSLNQKKVYESTPVSTSDIQNTIGGISEKDGKIIVAGLFNENLPFQNSLTCSGKFDFYVTKINPSDLSIEMAEQGNIVTPAVDVSKNEYITVYPMATAFSLNKVYSTVDYRLSLKPVDTYVRTNSSYSIVYDYKSGVVTPTQQAVNIYKNGIGAYDNKVSSVTINITSTEFDEGEFIVDQIIDGEGSAINNTVSDKAIIKAYPNPVNDILNFSGVCDVTIVNGQGSEVKSLGATTQISVADLAAGYYVARIKTADGTSVIPFIKK